MELKKIKGYIVGFAIGTTLGLTAFTNGGSFTGITSMTQTWFNAIQTKLDGVYGSGNLCMSDGNAQIQCTTSTTNVGQQFGTKTDGKFCTYSGTVVVCNSDILSTPGLGIPQNSQTFTASGTFTVPAGVTRLMVYGAHAGGGGGGGIYHSGRGVGGAGGGASVFSSPRIVNVTPGQQIAVTIGIGGAGGIGVSLALASGNPGSAGGTTSFGSLQWQGAEGGQSVSYGAAGSNGGAAAGGNSGVNGSDATGGYGIIYSQAQGGGIYVSLPTPAHRTSDGLGGTSDCNNGTAGTELTTTAGGNGGKGGDGMVIVYR